jgi:hypothetical protein
VPWYKYGSRNVRKSKSMSNEMVPQPPVRGRMPLFQPGRSGQAIPRASGADLGDAAAIDDCDQ